MKGERDHSIPPSTPSGQYSAGSSAAPTSFSGCSSACAFDRYDTAAEIEQGLLEAVEALPDSWVDAVALFRLDTYRDCLVGHLARDCRVRSNEVDLSGDAGVPRSADRSSPGERSTPGNRSIAGDRFLPGDRSEAIRRVRFSVEDTELAPVAAMITASTGQPLEDPGTGFEIEDPPELEKILAPGPWSYWPILGGKGPSGVLAIAGRVGSGDVLLETWLTAAGRALERTEGQEELARLGRQQRRVREAASAVGSAQSLTELYRRMVRIVARGTSAPWTRFLRGGLNERGLSVVAQCGAVPDPAGFEAALRREAQPCWDSLRPRVWSGQIGEAANEASGATWLIPVHAFEQPLGVLAVGRLANESVGTLERDEAFLETVAAQFALAIENARVGEELQRSRQRLRELQGQLLRSERLATLGEASAELASQSQPAVASIYETVREMLEPLEEEHELSEPLEGVCRELVRLDALLREQVALGRLSQPRLAVCSLTTLVADCLGSVQDDARLHGVEISERAGDGIPSLLLDHEKMREVITNLVRNALEGLGRGGRLVVRTQKQGHYVALEVVAVNRADEEETEGPASSGSESDDLLLRLFAPFESAQPGGSSLGLGVARQVIVDHGGELNVRREQSGDLVYQLRLPIRDNRDRRAGKDRRRSDRRRAA